MDFYEFLGKVQEEDNQTYTPFAAKNKNEWLPGTISIDFLNEHFSQYSTAEEMINATESEGLKLYFAWLRDKGILN